MVKIGVLRAYLFTRIPLLNESFFELKLDATVKCKKLHAEEKRVTRVDLLKLKHICKTLHSVHIS